MFIYLHYVLSDIEITDFNFSWQLSIDVDFLGYVSVQPTFGETLPPPSRV
jgi:hypothetical protein